MCLVLAAAAAALPASSDSLFFSQAPRCTSSVQGCPQLTVHRIDGLRACLLGCRAAKPNHASSPAPLQPTSCSTTMRTLASSRTVSPSERGVRGQLGRLRAGGRARRQAGRWTRRPLLERTADHACMPLLSRLCRFVCSDSMYGLPKGFDTRPLDPVPKNEEGRSAEKWAGLVQGAAQEAEAGLARLQGGAAAAGGSGQQAQQDQAQQQQAAAEQQAQQAAATAAEQQAQQAAATAAEQQAQQAAAAAAEQLAQQAAAAAAEQQAEVQQQAQNIAAEQQQLATATDAVAVAEQQQAIAAAAAELQAQAAVAAAAASDNAAAAREGAVTAGAAQQTGNAVAADQRQAAATGMQGAAQQGAAAGVAAEGQAGAGAEAVGDASDVAAVGRLEASEAEAFQQQEAMQQVAGGA